MSDIKKFLDYEGVQHLWSKINMNDYPNNETLINVINAIDETKADRSELVQSDWNENDETAINYIKSRTHYENIVTTSIVLVDEEVELIQAPDMMPCSFWSEPIALENGKTYTVIVNSMKQEIVCENDKLIFVDAPETGDTLTIKSEVIFGNIEYTYHIKIETTEISMIVKQLDEKYIPDTIARTEDIPSTAIKPFPYYAVNELNAFITQYKVNLEELEEGVLYSVQESASTPYVFFALCIICDDGTEKIVTNIATKTSVYKVVKTTTKRIIVYSVFGNDITTIDISDKSTSSNVVVTDDPISKWLPTSNRVEYTPTSEYHPATKKYVDDSVANSIPIPTTATIGQTIIIKAVDENGVPTEWEAVDIPVTSVNGQTGDVVIDIPEQIQSDWNQNDETATNYIKNKPILATSEEIKALFN